MQRPDYIFETSWEVCNKVGGIYAVLSTRAASMQHICKDKVFFIGPDLGQDKGNPFFKESNTLLKGWRQQATAEGLRVRVGRWLVPGSPIAILVNYDSYYSEKDSIFGHVWERYGVNSLQAYGDYDESAVFGWATGIVMESLYCFLQLEGKRVVAHFNEWMTAFGLFYVQEHLPQVGTLFTTHATSIGRSIAGNDKPLYDYFEGYHGDQMAQELNMVSKHSVEKQAAHYADCFTTVSDITDRECKQLLEKSADVVTPNGFESKFVPKTEDEFTQKRLQARTILTQVAEQVLGYKLKKHPLFVCTSGRYEWKNKGIDAFVAAMNILSKGSWKKKASSEVVAFIMVPAWQCGVWETLGAENHYTTHRLCQPGNDPVSEALRYYDINNRKETPVKVIFVPSYLTGDDGVFNLPYYDLLIGMDVSVFPSYYEPWGYTPLESVAFRVPTITTDLAGFGLWAEGEIQRNGFFPSLENGVAVVHRTDSNWQQFTEDIAAIVDEYRQIDKQRQHTARKMAAAIAVKANWKHFFKYYLEAYDIALSKR